MRSLLVVFALAFAFVPARVLANPEPPAYDARSVGLGGTGLAFLESAAAVFHNPANLAAVPRLDVSTTLTLVMVDLQAPVGGPGTEVHTGIEVAPLGCLAAAFRVHERLVLGLGIYLSTGFGGGYDDVQTLYGDDLGAPADQAVSLFVGELAAPLALRLHERVDLGIALRFPYAQQSARLHQEIFPGAYQPVEQHVSGFGVPGVLLGITYRLDAQISFAFTYRSKVRIDMEGTTTTELLGSSISLATETEWVLPHALGFGIAARLLEQRLLLAAEMRVQLHEEANESQVFVIEGEPDPIVAPLEWENVLSLRAGGEYQLSDAIALRVGYNLSTSATGEQAVQFFTPPPGLLHAIYAGLGSELGPFDVDLALHFSFGDATVAGSADRCMPGERIKVGCEGEYSVRSVWFSLSLRYQSPRPS